jgi:zinc protease
MKIRNYSVGLLLLTGILFGNKVLAQSTITTLLKTKPVAPDNKRIENYKFAEIKSYSFTYANGVKIVVRADVNSKVAEFRAIGRGGASLFDDADFQSAIHAGQIMGNSGLGDYTQAEISKFFQQKNITLAPAIDEKYSTLKGTFNPDDLEVFLQAVYLYFTQPRKDKAAFDSYIKSMEANTALHAKNPYNILQDTIARLTTGNENRVNILSATNIKQISLDKAYAIYRKCFSNARGFTFVITGNFEADGMNEPTSMVSMLSQYLGSLPSTSDTTKVENRNTEIPKGRIYKKLYNGDSTLAAVQLIYSGTYHYADSVNLQLKALSHLLQKKLDTLKAFNGANKALVKLEMNKLPKETYAVNIAFKCEPKKVEKMIAIAHEAIAVLRRGIDPSEIKQYYTFRKAEIKALTHTDTLFWPNYLAQQFVNYEDPCEIAHYPYNLGMANEHTVQQAANQFLTGDNYIQAILLPAKM